jgi:hypothetical protein
MQVFLSWSGEHSKQVALILKDWLPSVVQAIGDPWVSDADIDKGEGWFGSITDSLAKAEGVGIFCLTPDNLLAPWMAFEAGALAVSDRGRVATFLHGVTASDVKPPLSLFQATLASAKEDVLKLLKMLNKRVSVQLTEPRLERAFESNWNSLETALGSIKLEVKKVSKVTSEQMQLQMLDNILATVRRIEKDSSRRPDPPDFSGINSNSPSPFPSSGGLIAAMNASEGLSQADKFKKYADLLGKESISNWIISNQSEVEKLRGVLTSTSSDVQRLRGLLDSCVDPKKNPAILRED